VRSNISFYEIEKFYLVTFKLISFALHKILNFEIYYTKNDSSDLQNTKTFLLILILREIYYPFRILRHSSEFFISACFWDEIQQRIVRIDKNIWALDFIVWQSI